MTLKDFIFINNLEGSEREKEEKIVEYLGLAYDKNSLDDLRNRFSKLYLTNYSTKVKVFRYFNVNKKIWKIERNIRRCPASQFVLFDSYLNQDKEIMNNLHLILSIYIRPLKWFRIEKWDAEKHEHNANILLEADMKYIYPMISFFFLNVRRYIRNMNIIYLNQAQMEYQKEMMLEK